MTVSNSWGPKGYETVDEFGREREAKNIINYGGKTTPKGVSDSWLVEMCKMYHDEHGVLPNQLFLTGATNGIKSKSVIVSGIGVASCNINYNSKSDFVDYIPM